MRKVSSIREAITDITLIFFPLELACKIPERIGSLTLGVTSPGGSVWNNIPPVRNRLFYPWLNSVMDNAQLKAIASFANLMVTPNPIKMSRIVMDMLFTKTWLDELDVDNPRKTNREVQTEVSCSQTRKRSTRN